jgi:hypothetical protein
MDEQQEIRVGANAGEGPVDRSAEPEGPGRPHVAPSSTLEMSLGHSLQSWLFERIRRCIVYDQHVEKRIALGVETDETVFEPRSSVVSNDDREDAGYVVEAARLGRGTLLRCHAAS